MQNIAIKGIGGLVKTADKMQISSKKWKRKSGGWPVVAAGQSRNTTSCDVCQKEGVCEKSQAEFC